MPWKVEKGHGSCPESKPFAVVKQSNGSVSGCHSTRESAERQMRALYAQEPQLGGNMDGNPRLAEATVLAAEQIDAEGRQWVEVLPTAEKARNGPWYFTITTDDLAAYAESIKAAPGKIPIDYDHLGSKSDGSTRAAGWFTGEAEVRETDSGERLYAQVEWTPRAQQEIRDGEFRFMSAEFDFEHKDSKSGLLSKAKEILAATLTNRPFFRELAPVASLIESDLLDELAEAHGQEVADLLLKAAGSTEADLQEAVDAVLAAQWTTAFINDLPDSSFLHIDSGGTKDSEGKTAPRSLRHFPYKDGSGKVDLPHLRNAIARIPQSNVEDKAALQERARRILQNAGGGSQASEQEPQNVLGTNGSTTPPATTEKEFEMAHDSVISALGLPEHADEATIVKAIQARDEEKASLEAKIVTLEQKSADSVKLAERVAELEAQGKKREIESILAEEVRTGRVLPVEVNALAETFADNPDALKAVVNTRPPGLFAKAMKEQGYTGIGLDMPDPELARVKAEFSTGGRGDPIDEDSAKEHLAAMSILREQGKGTGYSSEDYVQALEQARSQPVH